VVEGHPLHHRYILVHPHFQRRQLPLRRLLHLSQLSRIMVSPSYSQILHHVKRGWGIGADLILLGVGKDIVQNNNNLNGASTGISSSMSVSSTSVATTSMTTSTSTSSSIVSSSTASGTTSSQSDMIGPSRCVRRSAMRRAESGDM
jgi:hypothetical protein